MDADSQTTRKTSLSVYPPEENRAKAGRSGGKLGTVHSSLSYPGQAWAADTKGEEIKVGKNPPSEKKNSKKARKKVIKTEHPHNAETSPLILANTYVGEEVGYAIES